MRTFAIWLLLTLPAFAMAPEERLADPTLEARARALSKEIRCVVCQNQSIDDSDAQVAKDLRQVVRDQLQAGASDEAIMQHLVERYGEFVRFRPPLRFATAVLWLTPLLLLFGLAIWYVGRRSQPSPEASPLTEAEEQALRELR